MSLFSIPIFKKRAEASEDPVLPSLRLVMPVLLCSASAKQQMFLEGSIMSDLRFYSEDIIVLFFNPCYIQDEIVK